MSATHIPKPIPLPAFGLQHSYAEALPQLCVPWRPQPVATPRLVFINRPLVAALGLPLAGLDEATLAALFCGNVLPPDARPVAQAYAGHQFGHFVPQLGDGRALVLGEVLDRAGRRYDLAFKGSGRTPFSRRGDGKAALAPMLREVIFSEALHALGIPTTRVLAVVATGEPVYRERVLPGAVLTRVAASHLRVGTFEYVRAHGGLDELRALADYAIQRHDPPLGGCPDRYLRLLEAVAERQARLVASWMAVGFVHGVMNTDNMSLSGESIDFGPCAFMEGFDPATVFSSIDEWGRYAYGNQPGIAAWNLARFAETLLPLIDADPDRAVARASAVIEAFPQRYRAHWLELMRAKLGLAEAAPRQDAQDEQLTQDWLDLLHAQQVDHTLAWRYLADAAAGEEVRLHALFPGQPGLDGWLARWRARCAAEDAARPTTHAPGPERAKRMRRVNPWIIPRNHRVEEALAAAEAGDLGPFERLLAAVTRPYDEDAAYISYAEPSPAAFMREFRTFCGT
ncbi:MAG: YdiU family protein [Thiobacillaceae bacterium]|nr:YdiU family protein [Thiobacillaceae bacterium]